MTTVEMTPFLRLALRLDAAVSGACGLLMAGLPGPLAALTGLPAPLLLGAGLFLLPYGGLLAWLGARAALPRPMLWLLVAGNLAWAVECAALPLLGWVAPNGWGIAFLAVQAVAVALFAEFYLVALRRAALRSAA